MPVPLGSIRVIRDGHPDTLFTFARVRAEGAQYDRTQHRAPYGTAWFTSGSRHRRPQEFELRFRIEAAGVLRHAATVTREAIAVVQDAVRIETPLGNILEPVVLTYTATPADGGAYHVTVRVSASTAEFVPDNAVLAGGDPVVAGEDFVVHE